MRRQGTKNNAVKNQQCGCANTNENSTGEGSKANSDIVSYVKPEHSEFAMERFLGLDPESSFTRVVHLFELIDHRWF